MERGFLARREPRMSLCRIGCVGCWAVHLFSLSALISFRAVQFFLIFLFVCVCGLFHVGVDVHLFGVHNVARLVRVHLY